VSKIFFSQNIFTKWKKFTTKESPDWIRDNHLRRLEKMPFYCSSQWRCCDNLVIRVLLLWLGLGSSLGEREKDCVMYWVVSRFRWRAWP
jgi:hypothetical protein